MSEQPVAEFKLFQDYEKSLDQLKHAAEALDDDIYSFPECEIALVPVDMLERWKAEAFKALLAAQAVYSYTHASHFVRAK